MNTQEITLILLGLFGLLVFVYDRFGYLVFKKKK